MTRISPDDRPYYQQTAFQNRFLYFYIEGNEIILVPNVSSNPTGYLVFSFWLRPNELVDESRVATISTITTNGNGTTTFTVDQIPTGFSTTSKFDLLQTNPGHKTYSFDKYATSVDSTNKLITFTTTDVSSQMVVGDYIAFAGECIIPQMPADLHDVLAQRVVCRCLNALGDATGLQMAQGKLAEMEKNTGILVDNRSEGSPSKIHNVRSLLWVSKISRKGWI